jgi:hypothetical protein
MERMWKKVVILHFWHPPGVNEEKLQKHQSGFPITQLIFELVTITPTY